MLLHTMSSSRNSLNDGHFEPYIPSSEALSMVCIHIASLLAPALGFEPRRPDLESGGLPLLQAGMSNKARNNNLKLQVLISKYSLCEPLLYIFII